MGRYLHLFETEGEYGAARESDYEEPWVSYTEETEKVNYNKTEDEKLIETPLTFEIIDDGIIYWKASGTNITKTIEYKINDGEWTSNGISALSITVEAGNTVQFRGNNTQYATSSQYNSFSGSTAQFNVKGNIMSLINSSDFSTLTTLPSSCTFKYLFYNCTGLTDASKLLLPATKIAEDCYMFMFQGCTSLTKAPSILPATKLASNCYNCMFYGCTSLTTAPELPATTLKSSCYEHMFDGCTSLTTAPELPATNLSGASGCYRYMFQGCTSLTTAPELPATNLSGASSCYSYMFQGCTSLTTAPELPATNLSGASSCYSYMFYGCTSLTTAPSILPATSLVNYCYSNMFRNCTSLTTAPELPAATLAQACYREMFYGCSNLKYIKCLATNISAANCTRDWTRNVASTGTFVKNPSMTSWTTNTWGIPANWTVQDAA